MTDVDPLAHAHSSESNEHYTPVSIVEPARRVLGKIDLDPASCEVANQVVQAKYYFREVGLVNALEAAWTTTNDQPSRVFLNPPGGKLDANLRPIKKGPGRSSAGIWWAKLFEEWEAGRVSSAIFICFSLNVFRMGQTYCERAPFEFPFCVPRERIRYDHVNELGERVPGTSPNQDSAIVYLPKRAYGVGSEWDSQAVENFLKEFSPLGRVRQ